LYKLDIFNTNAPDGDEKIFRTFWYNFADHCRSILNKPVDKFYVHDIKSILDSHNAVMIEDDLYFNSPEDVISFILRWS